MEINSGFLEHLVTKIVFVIGLSNLYLQIWTNRWEDKGSLVVDLCWPLSVTTMWILSGVPGKLDGIDLLEDNGEVDLGEYQAWAEMKMREALAAEAGRDPSAIAVGKGHQSA